MGEMSRRLLKHVQKKKRKTTKNEYYLICYLLNHKIFIVINNNFYAIDNPFLCQCYDLYESKQILQDVNLNVFIVLLVSRIVQYTFRNWN